MKRAWLLFLAACGARTARVPTPVDGSMPRITPLVAAPACPPAPLRPVIADAVAALEERRFARSDALLLAHLAVTPGDLAADLLLDAVRATVEEERALATTMTDARRIRLDASRRASPRAPSNARPPDLVPDLAGKSSAFHWRLEDMSPARRTLAPPWHAPVTGRQGERHVGKEDGVVTTFEMRGTEIIVTTPHGRPLVFELPSAPSTGLKDATVVDDVFLLSAMNEPLSAYDVVSGHLLWTAPSSVFAVAGPWVFSREEHRVHALDLHTGEIVRSVDLPGEVLGVFVDSGKLFASVHHENIELRSSVPLVPVPPRVEGSGRPSFWANARSGCAVRDAFAAVAARDIPKLDAALAAVDAHDEGRALVRALRRSRERLAAWSGRTQTDRIDLFAAPPVALSPPPWNGARAPAASIVRFRHVSSRHLDPLPDNPYALPGMSYVLIPPALEGEMPPGGRTDVPRHFGRHPLLELRPGARDADAALLLYSDRYLAVVKGQRAERVFDLDAYRHPPTAPPEKDFALVLAPTWVNHALLSDDVLYLCDGGIGVMPTSPDTSNHVTAIAYPSGDLRWRSAPQVCSAPMARWRGYILTASTGPGHPSLEALRLSDGAVVGRMAVRSLPFDLKVVGDRLEILGEGGEESVLTLAEGGT